MKLLITILAAIVSSVSYAEILNEADKKSFAEYYRSYIDLHKEFPDKLDVYVMFLDLNQDGKIDALATSYGDMYQDGWIWSAFTRNDNGEWKKFTRPKELTDETMIYARPDPDAFYRLKIENELSHVIIIKKQWAKGVLEPGISASQVNFNEKGVLILKEVPVPDQKELANYEQVKFETLKE